MRSCRYEDCPVLIGFEHFFCPEHRDTEYAKEYRKQNGGNQP
jgi:hypothetical protein